mgnify:CR=1 FL=1
MVSQERDGCKIVIECEVEREEVRDGNVERERGRKWSERERRANLELLLKVGRGSGTA